MNKNKTEIEIKINELKKEARELSLKGFEVTSIYEKRQHCLWYSGEIARFYHENYLITIEVAGDIFATLKDKNGKYITHVKDKWGNGNFFPIMKGYIPDDATLLSYLYPKKEEEELNLIVDNRNWMEFHIYDTDKKQWMDISLDNVLDEEDVLAMNLTRIMECVKYILL